MAIYTNEQYYEAILQLRPYNKKVYDFVLSEVGKVNKVYITLEEKKKYGVNIRLTSSKFAASLGKKLKQIFGGEIVRSKKLYGFSRKKGKVVYRLTICHRLKNEGNFN